MQTARTDAVCYRGFGLHIRAEDGLGCPGLPVDDGGGGRPTVHVRRAAPGELDRDWSPTEAVATRSRPEFSVHWWPDHGYRLTMPAAGRYGLDESGTTIVCEGEDDGRTGFGLVAQGLPLAATLAGLEPIHAAGVALDGRAALLAGPAGAGKSSVALHLVLGGAALLADDVVCLQERGRELVAHGGSGTLRIRDAERRRLGTAADALTGAPGFDGRLHLAAEPPPAAMPLWAVYLLERAPDEPPDGPPVGPATASWTDLLALTYNLSVRTPERLARQLALCHTIAERVPLRRAVVRPDLDAVSLARAVAADLRSLA